MRIGSINALSLLWYWRMLKILSRRRSSYDCGRNEKVCHADSLWLTAKKMPGEFMQKVTRGSVLANEIPALAKLIQSSSKNWNSLSHWTFRQRVQRLLQLEALDQRLQDDAVFTQEKLASKRSPLWFIQIWLYLEVWFSSQLWWDNDTTARSGRRILEHIMDLSNCQMGKYQVFGIIKSIRIDFRTCAQDLPLICWQKK